MPLKCEYKTKEAKSRISRVRPYQLSNYDRIYLVVDWL